MVLVTHMYVCSGGDRTGTPVHVHTLGVGVTVTVLMYVNFRWWGDGDDDGYTHAWVDVLVERL